MQQYAAGAPTSMARAPVRRSISFTPRGNRTSTATMRANQLQLWFASMAYVRRIGLHRAQFAKATCGTISLRLLKIGAFVRVSVRRIKVAMASGCPAADAWGRAASRLAAAANARTSPI
jgi:Transposase DDE domain group 1